MKNFNCFRENAFWLTDMLKGNPIRRHYNQIKFIYENFESHKATNLRKDNLARLINHCLRTVPYYFNQNGQSLNDFPIINKNIIRENPDNFISVNYKKSSLFEVTTSGSTGTPFCVFQDKIKRHRHIADNIFFNELAGLKLGNRLYYFRIWNSIIKRASFKNFLQNIIVQDASLLTKEAFSTFFAKYNSDNSSKNLLAYASTFEAMGRYIENHTNQINDSSTNSIISMSESLPEGTREQLKSYFSCPVISRYSNMENGFIAQQCKQDGQEYHINSASFHVEILELNKDIPVPPGKMGRIVVTDIFNFAMPLIRYDTGDIGIWHVSSKCDSKTQVLSNIEGRKVDFINDTYGNLLSPHVITNTMWKFSDIDQFQFIQLSKTEYLVKLNIKDIPPYNKEDEIRKELTKYLGPTATLNFDYVEEIPILNSGKRKKIINLMNVGNKNDL